MTTTNIAKPFECYPGDDWTFPLTFFNPAEGITTATAQDPTAQDLTGFLFTAFVLVSNKTPVQVTIAAQADANLLSAGKVQVVVPKTITATIPPDSRSFARCDSDTVVRLRVLCTDPSGLTTSLKIPIIVRAV
jgi:hypothetical protein